MKKKMPLRVAKKDPAWKRWLKAAALTLGFGVSVSSCGNMGGKAENLSKEDLMMKKHALNMKQNKNAVEIFEAGTIDAQLRVQEFDETTRTILAKNMKDYTAKANRYLKEGADLGVWTEAAKALLPQGKYLISSENGGNPEEFEQSAVGKVKVGDDEFRSFTAAKMDVDEISYVQNMVATKYDLDSAEGRKYVDAITAIRAMEIAQDKALKLEQSDNISKTYGSKGDTMSGAESAYLASKDYLSKNCLGRYEIVEIIEDEVPIVETPILSVSRPQNRER